MPVGAAGGAGGCPLAEGAFPASNASFWASILFPIPSISSLQKHLFPDVAYGHHPFSPSASEFEQTGREAKADSILQRSLDLILDEAVKTKQAYPVRITRYFITRISILCIMYKY